MTDSIYEMRKTYEALIAELDAFADRVTKERLAAGNYEYFYLTDFNADDENSVGEGVARDTPEYWERMLASAGFAAGMRAEDEGIDINAALGKMIW